MPIKRFNSDDYLVESSMGTWIGHEDHEKVLKVIADRVEKLAFAMRAPNVHTPQFIQLVIQIRNGQITP